MPFAGRTDSPRNCKIDKQGLSITEEQNRECVTTKIATVRDANMPSWKLQSKLYLRPRVITPRTEIEGNEQLYCSNGKTNT